MIVEIETESEAACRRREEGDMYNERDEEREHGRTAKQIRHRKRPAQFGRPWLGSHKLFQRSVNASSSSCHIPGPNNILHPKITQSQAPLAPPPSSTSPPRVYIPDREAVRMPERRSLLELHSLTRAAPRTPGSSPSPTHPSTWQSNA